MITTLERRVVGDGDLVRRAFDRVRGTNDPRTDLIDERWAWFRYVQVSLLRSLNFTLRFGDQRMPAGKPAFNDYLDIEYCVAAILARGLAPNDEWLGRTFWLLYPKGELRRIRRTRN